MSVFRVALSELKRLSGGVLPKLVLAAMTVIPLLYGGIYLYANWDPYGKVDDVKGALVMSDAGATDTEGKHVNTGEEVKNELLEAANFDWHTVDSRDQAVSDVKDGTYDFALVIPADFSQNLQSVGDFKPDENGNTGAIDPAQAGIEIITNDANNYILTNIVKTAGTTIRDKVASQAGNASANALLASFTTIHSNIQEAADGAEQVDSGTLQLSNAVDQLNSGANDLNSGAIKLSDGTVSLVDGANQLVDGQQQLADGASSLAGGANQLSSGAASADNGAQQLASGAQTLKTNLESASVGAGDLANGATTLSSGAQTLADGTQSLSDGANQLAQGTNSLADGAEQVSSGAGKLSTGASDLAAGTAELNAAIQQSGLKDVATGLQQICSDLAAENTSTASGDFATDLSNTVVSDLAQRTQTQLAPLVAAGTLTQAQADEIVAGINSDETKARVAGFNEQAVTDIRNGALTGRDGSAAKDLAQMSSQLKALKSSACASTGESSVAGSINSLTDAVSQVNSGAQSLSTGAATLATGASDLASGAQTLNENTEKLAAGAQSVNSGAGSLAAGAASLETGAKTLANGTDQLASGSQSLSSGADTLAEGTGSLANGAASLADGANTLSEGEQSALKGQQSLASGAGELKDGAASLADGTGSLTDGTGQLQNGTDELKDGTDQLASGLSDGVKQIPSLSEQEQNKVADVMSDPVSLGHDSLANGKNYGEGMGPFFMVLALWIGALMLVQTMRVTNSRALASGAPSLRISLGTWVPFGLVGIAQAFLLFAIVKFGLGFDMAHSWAVLFFLFFVALVYTAIIHGFVSILGAPGKLVALVVLILQLVTAGGMMPYETLPNSIRWMHSFFPMSYALGGVRRLVYGIDLGSMGIILLVLALWGIFGLMLGYIGTRKDRIWSLKKLNPEITV